MTNQPNGGPAFPTQFIMPNGDLQSPEDGMSLRDWFATHAMTVLLSACNVFPDENWRVDLALDAYKMADAMLKAREVDDETV